MHASTFGWGVMASTLALAFGLGCRTPPTVDAGDAGSSAPSGVSAPVTASASAAPSPTPATPAGESAPLWERPSDTELATTTSTARVPELAERIKELAAPLRTPRAVARMVRSLAKLDAGQGAQRGCEILRLPELSATSLEALPPREEAAREELASAALAAVAHGPASDAPCEGVARWLGDEPCPPWFRCGPKGPLTGREVSRQDEPLCTAAELAKVVRAELDRALIAEVEPTPSRPELLALAELSRRKNLPPELVAAHARRRYAVIQPKTPTCDRTLDVGTPCHCDEATMRDHVCRLKEGGIAQVELCRFNVDDAKKTIGDVSLTLP